MRRKAAANSIKLTPLPSKVLFFIEPSHHYFGHRVRASMEINNLVARKINEGCRGTSRMSLLNALISASGVK